MRTKQMGQKDPTQPDIKKSYRKYWQFIVGLVIVASSIPLIAIYLQDPAQLLVAGYMGMLLMGFGALVTWWGWRKQTTDVILNASKQQGVEKQQGKFNTLSIYSNAISFEHLGEELISQYGHPRRCRNDGQYYYVRIEQGGQFVEVVLPDHYDYYDPKEYANVLQLPAWRKYNERAVSLLEKLAPGFLILAQIVMVIGLIALSSPGGG